MDLLKKYFPFSFRKKADVKELIIHCVILFLVDVVVGAIIGLFGAILPILGVILGIPGGLVGLYAFISIILAILDYLTVLK